MYSIKPVGDRGLCVQFPYEMNPDVNLKIMHFAEMVVKQKIPGLVEVVPAYTTCTIFYDPIETDYETLKEQVQKVKIEVSSRVQATTIYIPTLYDGMDFHRVADKNGLTTQEIIQLHSGPHYHVYMLGFLPGFPYLWGLPQKLETPRLDSPRLKIPAGSVGIAGMQTGIYPLESPGGWNIIGRTPVKLFDVKREKPFLFQAGNKVKFEPITKDAYDEITRLIERGEYDVKREVFT